MASQADIEAQFKEFKTWLKKKDAASEKRITDRINDFTSVVKELQEQVAILTQENKNLLFKVDRVTEEVKHLRGKDNARNMIIQNFRPISEEETEEALKEGIIDMFKSTTEIRQDPTNSNDSIRAESKEADFSSHATYP